jgi:hypothetical protein
MNCADARTRLAARHDGELAPAERALVDEHLRGCGECSAILARLAGIDANVDVPDPGPEYWEQFNRRVMERVENDAAVPAKVLRPKRGWARRQLPYFIPAVAAAALLLVIVRQTGMDPFSRTSAPPAPREAPGAVMQAAQKAASGADAGAVPRAAPPSGALPPVPGASLRKEKTAAPQAAPPAILPDEGGRSADSPAGKPASLAGERIAGADGEDKTRAARSVEASPAPSPEPVRGDAAFTSPGAGVKEESAAPAEREGKGVAQGQADRALSRSMAAAAPAAVPSPCEEARSLAGRGRLKEAESAQRACLARKNPPEAQESGMVFLAELLDRQSRFDEADAVLRETERRFPESRPVDAYLRQRSRVQGRPVPETR